MLPDMTWDAASSCSEAEIMAVPLSVCTKEEQRAVVCFLQAEVVKGPEIHTMLCAEYGCDDTWIHSKDHQRVQCKYP
jgi:hypothetical protein